MINIKNKGVYSREVTIEKDGLITTERRLVNVLGIGDVYVFLKCKVTKEEYLTDIYNFDTEKGKYKYWGGKEEDEYRSTI